MAQHSHYYSETVADGAPFASAFSWQCTPMERHQASMEEDNVYDEQDRVKDLHPVYVIPHVAVHATKAWSNMQTSSWMQ